MKKILICAFFLSVIMCSSFGCTKSSVSEKIYLSECDSYNQIQIFKINALNDFSENTVRYFVNKDDKYISQGTGSLEINLLKPMECYATYISSSNSYSSLMDLSDVYKLHFDVFNPNEQQLSMLFFAKTANCIVASEYVDLKPGEWTKTDSVINRYKIKTLDENVMYYYFYFYNLLSPESSFNIYFDNFYAQKSTSDIVENEKQFKDNEILDFDSIDDLNYVGIIDKSRFHRLNVDVGLNSVPQFCKQGNSLKLSVKKLFNVSLNEKLEMSREIYGVKVFQNITDKIDFTKQGGILSVDVYNDDTAKKRVILRISDDNGKYQECSKYVFGNTWEKLEISDFSEITLTKVKSVELLIEGYQAFGDFDIYFDNLQFGVN